MPQFVKMGLNGTGYLGKQEAHTRAARKRMARRKVVPGFPETTPFAAIEDVRKYLSGDSMICLLCGKNYKRIGTHLVKIHGITVDEYKQRYNIPWTYGLICDESSGKYSKAIKKRMMEGWEPPMKLGDDHKKMISAEKRGCKFKVEVAKTNLKKSRNRGAPVHPLSVAPDGTLETFTQKRDRLAAKRGSDEFRAKMLNRPQCQAEFVKDRGFNKFWLGKKQSEEHIKKRFSKRKMPS